MTTPTSNPVPSRAPQDLLFNVELLDAGLNSSAPTYTDRLGVERMTPAGAIASIATVTSRGNWAAATAYAVKDLVRFDSTWYICLEAHTSAASFATDAAKWRPYQTPDAQVPELVVATQGQTLVTFTTFSYTPNTGAVFVTLNELPAEITETSPNSVTFADALMAGDRVRIRRGNLAHPSTALQTMQASVTAAGVSAAAAAVSAGQAAAAQALAEAAANYKGAWSTLSGALNIPASVFHAGAFWVLLSNLANVALAEPGVSASWRVVAHPAGTEPDQCPRNRDLGAGAYLNIARLPPSSGAGYATGVTAGTPQSVTVAVPGLRAEDFIVGVSLSINMPANLRVVAAVSADDTARVTYLSDSGTVTPGAHTVHIRAEKRIPEA